LKGGKRGRETQVKGHTGKNQRKQERLVFLCRCCFLRTSSSALLELGSCSSSPLFPWFFYFLSSTFLCLKKSPKARSLLRVSKFSEGEREEERGWKRASGDKKNAPRILSSVQEDNDHSNSPTLIISICEKRERERERKLEGHVVQVYQRKGKGTNVKHDEGNLCVHKRNRGGTTRRGTESREERMRDEEEQTFLSFFSS
jgi:hypothetical protein